MLSKLKYLLLLNLLFGCKKIFHNEEISVGKITNYQQLVLAVGGVYGSLANALYDKSFYFANVKGDDINWGIAKYDSSFNILQKTSSNLIVFQSVLNNSLVWKTMYPSIISANNIIVQYKPFLKQNRSLQELLGEVYFIRAYCYFRLTRNYGQIPIIDDIDITYNKSRASYNDIYSFIVNDLKIAMELLPKNNSFARIPFVTPHRGSAKAILAEVYLSWAGYPANDPSKYIDAAKEARETIDSSGYFGMGLLDDFAYLWDKNHLYNSESVFSLYIPNSPSKRNSNFDFETVFDGGAGALYTGLYYTSGYNYSLMPGIDISTNFFQQKLTFITIIHRITEKI
jgi:hypothetical protein